MIQNILFDMGGVIFRQDSNEAFKRFAAMGIDTDRYLGHYGQKEFFLDLEMGKIDCKEFCRLMSLACGKEVSEMQAAHCWLGYIRDVPLDRLHCLEDLRGRGYHLGLASNTNLFVMDYMDSPKISPDAKPISSYFDALYCSYLLGICKPAPEYFQKIIELNNLRPQETLFLDDSEKNIRAAERVGIQGMLIAPDEDWTDRLYERLSIPR